MKRGSILTLIIIYSLSTFGVSLKEFYCCGKLNSVAVSIIDDAKEKGGKGCNTDGCCKTTHHYFKVKDNHVASSDVVAPTKYFTGLVSFNFYESFSFIPKQARIINGRHAPPLYAGVPVYLSNCVFRI